MDNDYFAIWHNCTFVGDNKTTLDPEDDAATSNWGGKWKMPTAEQMKELINECYWVLTERYNDTAVVGYIVYKAKNNSDKGKYVYKMEDISSDYSTTDVHIFIPLAGSKSKEYYYNEYSSYESGYWTNTLGDMTFSSQQLRFVSSSILVMGAGPSEANRPCGLSIRPIWPK